MSIKIDITDASARIQTALRDSNNKDSDPKSDRESVSANVAGPYSLPDPVTLAKIARESGIPLRWLLGFDDDNLPGHCTESESGSRGPEAGETSRSVPPPVNMVLNHPHLKSARDHMAPSFLVDLVRDEIEKTAQHDVPVKEAATRLAKVVAARVAEFTLKPRDRVNATGVIIHTGWGNARLHPNASKRILEACNATETGAVNAPARTEMCERLLCAITGAEAATVTTLNAVNYVLLAGSMAVGKEIIVAAKDLVEISQGARIGDLLESAGARVVPVGSANCVYVDDYKRAITADTAIILRIHVSNVATSGYISHVESAELAELARANNLVFAENLGGGSLVDLADHGLPTCPTLQQGLASGADLVFASGDKIIGGPQAGIVIGKSRHVDRLAKHPLARACRPDKLLLSALEATLGVYLAGRAWDEIPVLRLLSEDVARLEERAANIAEVLRGYGYDAEHVTDTAECGGAVLPGVELRTWAVRIRHAEMEEDQLHAILLARGVVARRKQGAVLLDLRSVAPEEDALLQDALLP
jgi:L-seryl-tRNA(Ser) seleniumtransferase